MLLCRIMWLTEMGWLLIDWYVVCVARVGGKMVVIKTAQFTAWLLCNRLKVVRRAPCTGNAKIMGNFSLHLSRLHLMGFFNYFFLPTIQCKRLNILDAAVGSELAISTEERDPGVRVVLWKYHLNVKYWFKKKKLKKGTEQGICHYAYIWTQFSVLAYLQYYISE